MKKKLIPFAFICLLINIFITPSFAANAQANQDWINSKPTTITTPKQIPHQDIDRFVLALNTIKSYYIKETSDSQLFTDAIKGMADELDPHSTYLTKKDLDAFDESIYGNYAGIGIEITTSHGLLQVISPIDNSPAQKAGLKPGDIIVKVNKTLLRDTTATHAISLIKGKPGTSVTLTVLRPGTPEPLIKKIKREKIDYDAIKTELVAKHYGMIRMSYFQHDSKKHLQKAFKKLQRKSKNQLYGLILDLRSNPGGILSAAVDTVNSFLNKKTLHDKYKDRIVYTLGRTKDSDKSFYVDNGDMTHDLPLIILINAGSASASEIVAGALQDYHRAIIVGEKSFGKGSVQTVIPISNESAIKLTTALYYTPAGREIQAQGIIPNVIVPQITLPKDDNKVNALDISEANFENYVKNTKSLTGKVPMGLIQQETLQKLAHKDFQLYQAYLLLQGMHAIQAPKK